MAASRPSDLAELSVEGVGCFRASRPATPSSLALERAGVGSAAAEAAPGSQPAAALQANGDFGSAAAQPPLVTACPDLQLSVVATEAVYINFSHDELPEEAEADGSSSSGAAAASMTPRVWVAEAEAQVPSPASALAAADGQPASPGEAGSGSWQFAEQPADEQPAEDRLPVGVSQQWEAGGCSDAVVEVALALWPAGSKQPAGSDPEDTASTDSGLEELPGQPVDSAGWRSLDQEGAGLEEAPLQDELAAPAALRSADSEQPALECSSVPVGGSPQVQPAAAAAAGASAERATGAAADVEPADMSEAEAEEQQAPCSAAAVHLSEDWEGQLGAAGPAAAQQASLPQDSGDEEAVGSAACSSPTEEEQGLLDGAGQPAELTPDEHVPEPADVAEAGEGGAEEAEAAGAEAADPPAAAPAAQQERSVEQEGSPPAEVAALPAVAEAACVPSAAQAELELELAPPLLPPLEQLEAGAEPEEGAAAGSPELESEPQVQALLLPPPPSAQQPQPPSAAPEQAALAGQAEEQLAAVVRPVQEQPEPQTALPSASSEQPSPAAEALPLAVPEQEQEQLQAAPARQAPEELLPATEALPLAAPDQEQEQPHPQAAPARQPPEELAPASLAAPLALPPPPLVTFPVQQLQAVLGSGLRTMRNRLQGAVEREGALRLESEMAAVEREAMMQAQALVEAALSAERTARLAAEMELQHLAAETEGERASWEEQLAEGQGQLRAARSALRALEMKVASQQAELRGEQERRRGAEQQLEQARQREAALLGRPGPVQRNGWRQQQKPLEVQAVVSSDAQAALASGAREEASSQPASMPAAASAPGPQQQPSSGAGAAGVGVPAVDVLRHVVQLQQDLAALKAQAQPPAAAPPSAAGVGVPAVDVLRHVLLLQQDLAALKAQAQPPAVAPPLAAAAEQALQGSTAGTAEQPRLPAASTYLRAPGVGPSPLTVLASAAARPDLAGQHKAAQPPAAWPQQQGQGLPMAGVPTVPPAGRPQPHGPSSPARAYGTAPQALAEVRTWLQQQQPQQGHPSLGVQPQQAWHGQQPFPSQPQPRYPPAGTVQGWPQHEQQLPQRPSSPLDRPTSPPRRPPHEPACLSDSSRPGSAKRRLVQPRPPSRWDYRPAWNGEQGGRPSSGSPVRVDDLPMSAAAASARSRQAYAETGLPKQAGAPGAVASNATPARPPSQQPPWQQRPSMPAAPPSNSSAASQAWPAVVQPPGSAAGPLQPLNGMPASQAAFQPLPQAFGGSPAAAVIHQYFSPPSAMDLQFEPAAAAQPLLMAQFWHPQWHQGMLGGPAADPLSRPTTAGAAAGILYQQMHWQQQAGPAQQQQQQRAPQQARYGQRSRPGPDVHQPQSARRPTPPQEQRRPATPAAGLLRPQGGGLAVGEVYMPQAAAGGSTPRPRSAAQRDKPLAVPPGQVEERALAAAREEYVREKERIRAKRQRELQESADFRLQ